MDSQIFLKQVCHTETHVLSHLFIWKHKSQYPSLKYKEEEEKEEGEQEKEEAEEEEEKEQEEKKEESFHWEQTFSIHGYN